MQTSVAGWLEAFGAHPRIGDAAALKAKLGGFADMSRHEQASATGAPEAVYQVSCKLEQPAHLSRFRITRHVLCQSG